MNSVGRRRDVEQVVGAADVTIDVVARRQRVRTARLSRVEQRDRRLELLEDRHVVGAAQGDAVTRIEVRAHQRRVVRVRRDVDVAPVRCRLVGRAVHDRLRHAVGVDPPRRRSRCGTGAAPRTRGSSCSPWSVFSSRIASLTVETRLRAKNGRPPAPVTPESCTRFRFWYLMSWIVFDHTKSTVPTRPPGSCVSPPRLPRRIDGYLKSGIDHVDLVVERPCRRAGHGRRLVQRIGRRTECDCWRCCRRRCG